jgi:nucleoside-diphosphate-sugar epimerase
VDYVFHEAAVTSVPQSTRNPLAAHHTNITGTLNLLIAARDAGVRRVVYAASTAAYGDPPELPHHEGLLTSPRSEYAASKLAGEAYCQAFWRTHGLETVALRYFNVFGPRQNLDSLYGAVVPLFIAAALRREAPVIFGDGAQTRDFTFVGNVVDANLLACEAPVERVAGGVFNIGCGRATSIRELWQHIAAITGIGIEPRHERARAGDVRHSRAAITLAHEELGYEPAMSLEDGLRQTIAYYSDRLYAPALPARRLPPREPVALSQQLRVS